MKRRTKLRTPSEISEAEGPKSPRTYYVLDALHEWVDGARGKASRSAVVNEALRFYKASLETKSGGGKGKP